MARLNYSVSKERFLTHLIGFAILVIGELVLAAAMPIETNAILTACSPAKAAFDMMITFAQSTITAPSTTSHKSLRFGQDMQIVSDNLRRIAQLTTQGSLPPGESQHILVSEQALSDACFAAPSRTCVLGLALAAARETEYPNKPIFDTVRRPSVMGDIALALAKGGDTEGGRKVLTEAVEAANQVKNWAERCSVLIGLVEMWAKLGDVDRALAIANQMEYPGWRCPALLRIADELAKQGNLSGARSMIADAIAATDQIKDEFSRNVNLSRIARSQAIVGDVKGALATAVRIGNETSRAEAYEYILETPVKLAEVETLFSAVQSFKDALAQARALAKIGLTQAKMGDRAGAAKTFEAALVAAGKETRNADGRNRALQKIAEAQAKVGMFNEAFKTVDRMRGWDLHPAAPDIIRAQALTSIATEQFAAGDVKGALATARLVPWATEYARLATAHARTGDVEGARRTIEEAIRKVNKESNKEMQALALGEIAEAQVLLGDTKAARDSAERIEFKPSRAGVLVNIASIQKTRNDHAGAIETARIALSVIGGFEHPLTRAQFLLWIANTLD